MRKWQWWVLAVSLAAALSWTALRGAVGPTPAGDGTYNLLSPRIDKTGSAVVQQSGGKYGECSLRQITFCACDQGTGITPTTSLSTTSMVSVYNPAGNNQRIRIQNVSLSYVSGTLSSGPVYHCAIVSTSQAAPTGGTLLTNTCLDIGTNTTGTAVVRTGSTVAAGVKALRPLCNLAPQLASSVTAAAVVRDDVDGEFVVEPGASYNVQSVQAGAGTSPLVSIGVTWTEEPIK